MASVYEVASHQTTKDMDIIAAGKREEVTSVQEALDTAYTIVDEIHPFVGYHIDGEHVSFYEFRRRMREENPTA